VFAAHLLLPLRAGGDNARQDEVGVGGDQRAWKTRPAVPYPTSPTRIGAGIS